MSSREQTMAYDKAPDFLEPIDLAEHLDKIELYLGQVCQIAGISKMQLDYWTNKAHIPTKGNKQRIYEIEALETVMLIKQAKPLGRQVTRRSEPRPEAVRLVLDRGDQALVWRAPRVGAQEHETVALLDHARSLVQLALQVVAEPAGNPALGPREGRLRPQPDQLRGREGQ